MKQFIYVDNSKYVFPHGSPVIAVYYAESIMDVDKLFKLDFGHKHNVNSPTIACRILEINIDERDKII